LIQVPDSSGGEVTTRGPEVLLVILPNTTTHMIIQMYVSQNLRC